VRRGVNCYPDGYTAPTYSPPHVCGWGDAYERLQRMKAETDYSGWAPVKAAMTLRVGPGQELLPWQAIRAIAAMMAEMLATGKHGRDDWRRMAMIEHLDHADAHIGNHFDGDTSEDHLLHAACRLLMAVEQRLTHDLPGFAVETDHVKSDVRVFEDDGEPE
jgi:hypothetical protein